MITKEFALGGYRFCRADSIEQRQAAYALRFRVYAAHAIAGGLALDRINQLEQLCIGRVALAPA